VRQRKLLAAARALFHEKGFAATSIDDIIARTGGSKGSLYIYFASKYDLFELIVREEAGRFSQALTSTLAKAEHNEVGLHKIAEHLLLIATNDETIGLLRMVIAERHKYPRIGEIYYAIIAPMQEKVRQIFRQFSQVRGGCTSEPDFLADLFLSTVVADAQLAILTGQTDDLNGEWIRQQMHQRLSIILDSQFPAGFRDVRSSASAEDQRC